MVVLSGESLSACVILYAFAMPSGITASGYLAGSTGYVASALLLGINLAASVAGSWMLLAVILDLDSACGDRPRDMGQVGFAVGARRLGKLGKILQYANFFLFLPVGLDMCATCVKALFPSLFPPSSEKYTLLCALPCLLLTQVRTVKSKALVAFSYITFALVIIMGIFQVYVVYESPPPTTAIEPMLLFGNPVNGFRGVVEGALASTAATWCFVPVFLTAELASTMESPQNLFGSVLFSAACTFASMIIVGVATVAIWGSSIANPINVSAQWLSSSTARAAEEAFNWILLFANFGAYMLDSVQLGQATCLRLFPGFRLDDWSLGSSAVYLCATLLPTAGGIALSIFVPDVFSMLSYSTALTVSASNHIYPALVFLHRFPLCKRDDMQSSLLYAEKEEGARRSGRSASRGRTLAKAVLTFGTVNSAVCLFAAVGGTVLAQNS